MDAKAREIVMDVLRRYGITDECAAEDVRFALREGEFAIVPVDARAEQRVQLIPEAAAFWEEWERQVREPQLPRNMTEIAREAYLRERLWHHAHNILVMLRRPPPPVPPEDKA